MKKIILLLAGCWAAGVAVAAAAGRPGPAKPSAAVLSAAADRAGITDIGYIIGMVLDAGLGTPISNVEIHLSAGEWYTMSDDSGSFAFVDVPPGEYQVSATALGYFSQIQTVTLGEGQVGWVTFLLQRREYLPMALSAHPIGPNVHLSWSLQRPQTRIAHHNTKPVSGWFQRLHSGYGVLFDLSGFQDASLEQLDFNHYAWQVLHGPYLYRIHIYDLADSTEVARIDGITSQDSYASPQWETAVDLGGLTGLSRVGIFIEPLSGSAEDAHPVISTDDHLPAFYGVNYLIEDLDHPFAAMIDARAKNSGYGNFLIDLWINHNGTVQRIAGGAVDASPVSACAAGSTRGRIPAAEEERRPANVQSLHGFMIYRSSVDQPMRMSLLARVAADQTSFLDTHALQDSSYVYGVSALYDTLESSITVLRYDHPPLLSIAQAREDADADGVPDRLGQPVTVEGVVSTQNYGRRGLTDFYLQDEHSGLHASSRALAVSLQPGQRVFVSGHIDTLNGLTDLVLIPGSVQIIAADVPLIKTALRKAEWVKTKESLLIRINGLTLIDPSSWPAAGQDGLVKMTDGQDTVQVFIDLSTDIAGSPAPLGFYTVTGVLDYTTADGWQIRPRRLDDFALTVDVAHRQDHSVVRYGLEQNHPNPFNASTTFVFSLSQTEPVRVRLHDATGREVRLIFSGTLSAGVHRFTVDGRSLGSGLYFYQVETPSFRQCRKMTLLR